MQCEEKKTRKPSLSLVPRRSPCRPVRPSCPACGALRPRGASRSYAGDLLERFVSKNVDMCLPSRRAFFFRVCVCVHGCSCSLPTFVRPFLKCCHGMETVCTTWTRERTEILWTHALAAAWASAFFSVYCLYLSVLHASSLNFPRSSCFS